MMTSTSAVSRDPSVSMSRDDDQAKAGLDTTLPVGCDTDPGTSTSRPELVKLWLDRDSSVDELRKAYRPIVICLKPELKPGKKVRRLWQDLPEGWPEDVSFRDPNNDSKRGKKPRKDELFAMYKTAVGLYIQTYPEGIPTMDRMPLTVDVSQPQRSVTCSSTCEHLETASGGDAVNKRQQQGTQPEEFNMSTLCQQPWSELGIKHLGPGSPDASRNIKDRRDSDTEVNGNQGVMIAGGTYPMVVKDVPRPKLQVGMDPFTSSVSETRMDEALDKYGQACDGVSPTLVSFQSQPPEAGHWDSAQSKTAAGGSDVTSLRQGKQPEESSMSACSELRKKRLGTGLPADCSASDRQHSNAEVNENQGVPMVVKEGPEPAPGPQLQGAESEVTGGQGLRVVGVGAPMLINAPVQGQSSDSSAYKLDITGDLMVASGIPAVATMQPAVSSQEIAIVDVDVSGPIAGEAGSEIRHPVYSSYEDPGTSSIWETLSDEAPDHDKAWMGLPASDLIDQLKLLDDDGAETTGLSTGKDPMFSGQLTDIHTDNPLMDSFSNNNVSSPEVQILNISMSRKSRKKTRENASRQL